MPQTLTLTGVVLFLAGLLTGFAIPAFKSSRIGLSAHLAGVQSGTFLIAMGLLWPHLALSGAMSAALGHGLWISLYGLFASLALAAGFGAGRGLPIAGGGIATSQGRETIVSAALIASSLALLLIVAALLLTWHWQ